MIGTRTWMVCAFAVFATGCQGSAVVVGNLATMCVVVLMFWSTLRLKGN